MVSVLRQQRRIACHRHHVAVALDIRQVERLRECRLHVGSPCVRRGGILPEIHLRQLPVVAVVVVTVVHEPARRFVVVLIHHILQLRVLAGEVPALDIVSARRVEWSHGTTDPDVRILLSDGLADHLIALLEDRRDDILVADADILQVERLGMSRLCPHLRPLRGGRVPVGPLDHRQQLLDVCRHLRHGDAPLLSTDAVAVISTVLTRHPRRQHGQRLRPDILTELEILIESQSACLVIVPDVEVRLALFQRPYGVVPVVDVRQPLSVTHAAPWEPHELRLQRRDGLRQILAQSVLAAHEGLLREETHHVDARPLRLQAYQSQSRLVTGHLRRERRLVALPVVTLRLHLRLSDHRAERVHELHDEVLLQRSPVVARPHVPDEHREVILRPLLHGDAVPALVVERVLADDGIVRVVGTQRIHLYDVDGLRGMPGRRGAPAPMILRRIFEVTVLYHLRVETTVRRIADILEEDTDEIPADRLLLGSHTQRGRHRVARHLRVLRVVVHPLAAALGVSPQRLEVRRHRLQLPW